MQRDAGDGWPLSPAGRRALAAGIAFVFATLSSLLLVTERVVAEARAKETASQLANFADCLAMVLSVRGTFPTTLEGLDEPTSRCWEDGPPAAWVDPYGHPYEYVRESRFRVRVRSFGADGLPGGDGADADREVVVDSRTIQGGSCPPWGPDPREPPR
jgi:hypothetical protein